MFWWRVFLFGILVSLITISGIGCTKRRQVVQLAYRGLFGLILGRRGHVTFHTRHQDGMQPFTPDIKRACNLSHPTSRRHATFHTRHQEGMQPFTPDIKRACNLSHPTLRRHAAFHTRHQEGIQPFHTRHQEGIQPFHTDIKWAVRAHGRAGTRACTQSRSSLLNVIEEIPDNLY